MCQLNVFYFRAFQTDQLHGLKLIKYLLKEEDYLPWASLSSAIVYIDNMIAPTSYYSNFKTYIRRITTPLYDKLAWVEELSFTDR